jgi:predicted metalloprotease with PDZ domain
MCKSILFILLFCTTGFSQHKFYLNLYNIKDDLFKVTVNPENLSAENNIYNFAATAPGTYQIMDIGRFVKSFYAFDENGNEVAVKNISLNQWELSAPEKIKKIEYTIAETWDTPVNENHIWLMAGTSIEDDHILINGQAVFGYFKGMQKFPLAIKLDHPDEWMVGTALRKNKDGFYEARDYNHVVDSPFLAGELSHASTKVDKTEIDIYTYSKTDMVKSADILLAIEDILTASGEFLKGLPINHYTFLFHFEDISMGAWEHSYSSEYVYKEEPLTEGRINALRSTIAHEFFHIVTPLNIHSELIENFNFEKPVLSQHLWLYEASTEWAAKMMELRSGLVSLDYHLKILRQKMNLNDHFDQDIDLKTLALNATEMQDQYINIYYKGAVIIEMLDILLLDLSEGKRGLREVILELSKKYGPEQSFDEKNFLNEFYSYTFPEVKLFFELITLSFTAAIVLKLQWVLKWFLKMKNFWLCLITIPRLQL